MGEEINAPKLRRVHTCANISNRTTCLIYEDLLKKNKHYTISAGFLGLLPLEVPLLIGFLLLWKDPWRESITEPSGHLPLLSFGSKLLGPQVYMTNFRTCKAARSIWLIDPAGSRVDIMLILWSRCDLPCSNFSEHVVCSEFSAFWYPRHGASLFFLRTEMSTC